MKNETGAQGAVPGPQEDAIVSAVEEIWELMSGSVKYDQWDIGAIIRKHLQATPEPHSPPITSGYVQEVRPDDAEGPSCHVCGAEMVKVSSASMPEGELARPYYRCLSCGATTGCTPADPRR